VVREGYAKAAAAAGVKTLFCGDFGRRFFIYTVYMVQAVVDQNWST
jgi:hypothetical protein